MKFQFSFSEKVELIYIDEAPLEMKLGSLFQSVIDADWPRIGNKIERVAENVFGTSEEHVFAFNKHLSEAINHPALVYHFAKCKDLDEFFERLDEMDEAKKTALMIMESLVDEDSVHYREALFDLLYLKTPSLLSHCMIRTEEAHILPFAERVMPIYSNAKSFLFLFETSDIRTILFQEIQFLCDNSFIVRKCANCKRFFWTRRTNGVYCNRVADGTDKTCSQVGPSHRCVEKRSGAYKKYWAVRTRLYNHQTTKRDKTRYQTWIKRTEKYRNLAKKNAITEKEMADVLKKIEHEVYHTATIDNTVQGKII